MIPDLPRGALLKIAHFLRQLLYTLISVDIDGIDLLRFGGISRPPGPDQL